MYSYTSVKSHFRHGLDFHSHIPLYFGMSSLVCLCCFDFLSLSVFPLFLPSLMSCYPPPLWCILSRVFTSFLSSSSSSVCLYFRCFPVGLLLCVFFLRGFWLWIYLDFLKFHFTFKVNQSC